MGIKKAAIQKAAERAFMEGLSGKEIPTRLIKYIHSRRYKNGSVYKIHGEYIFIFQGNKKKEFYLITILHVPPGCKKVLHLTGRTN